MSENQPVDHHHHRVEALFQAALQQPEGSKSKKQIETLIARYQELQAAINDYNSSEMRAKIGEVAALLFVSVGILILIAYVPLMDTSKLSEYIPEIGVKTITLLATLSTLFAVGRLTHLITFSYIRRKSLPPPSTKRMNPRHQNYLSKRKNFLNTAQALGVDLKEWSNRDQDELVLLLVTLVREHLAQSP